jgi:hypothetical protein
MWPTGSLSYERNSLPRIDHLEVKRPFLSRRPVAADVMQLRDLSIHGRNGSTGIPYNAGGPRI